MSDNQGKPAFGNLGTKHKGHLRARLPRAACLLTMETHLGMTAKMLGSKYGVSYSLVAQRIYESGVRELVERKRPKPPSEPTPQPSTEWMNDRACIGRPPEMFFPTSASEAVLAKRVCAHCPVREQCLEFALANHEKYGIYGGMGVKQRNKLQAARRRAQRAAEHEAGAA